ncbi:AzlC family ABC transporter permease [Actinoplanes sp. N902-109]|uniref:AzlC family ABC transporter permease n=1 Tax=Actinoplanes sp. (strain N902-109) TaxID=649831 RepID=UPI000329546F|nr:AzlC family ABC transporter permease [Actinoplanes sp. N902-109]AGL15389.1 AzlC family protein [Actinoplanes sp. N902-109]
MRTAKRTHQTALLRDAAALAAAMIAVGGSFGAITVTYDLPTWVPFAMSTLVFAGGAQFLAVGLFAAGNPVAAVLAGLLLNARHLPFGLAVSATIGPRPLHRLLGSHLMTDETVAFTLREPDPAHRRRTYWLIGLTLFTSWNIGTALGVLLGGAVSNTDTLGLDAAFPAGLIALILPSLRDRATRAVALTGAALAVLLTPVLPAGLPVLCALLGLLTLFLPALRRPAAVPNDTTPAVGDTTHAVRGAAPAVRGTAPAVRGAAPAGGGTAPAAGGAAAADSGAGPVSGGAGADGGGAGAAGGGAGGAGAAGGGAGPAGGGADPAPGGAGSGLRRPPVGKAGEEADAEAEAGQR